MGLAGEMRNSREVGTGYYYFFFPHLPFFRTPVVGGTTGVAVEVDMIEYVTWKKSNSKWKIQESGWGKGNVKPKEKARDGDRVFLIDYLDLIKCLGVR